MVNSLKGKTVVFTGTLKMVRAVATTYAVKAGANVTKSVSGKTDIVVAGGHALGGWGSKVDAAKAKGVEVWSEAKFMKAYNQAMNLPASGSDDDEGSETSDAKPALSAAGKAAQHPPSWQWYDDGKSSWVSFASSDSDLIEGRFTASDFKFGVTSELSFNKSHNTLYEFDLLGKKQKNTDSGRVRKIRRVRNGVEDYTRITLKAAGKAVKRGRDDSDDDDDEEDDGSDEDSGEFWNADSGAHSEVKVTPSVIGKVQQALGGKKLPQAYINLCQKSGQNGGAPKKCYIIPPGKDEDHKLQVETIYGIAMDGVVGEQENWTDEWEYPDIGIYFADTESGGHDMWALDYRKCGPKGEPTVVHVEQESDPEYEITKVADNFQEFLDKLIADPDDE